MNADPNWYASTVIHDGGHAWLSQHGQLATGVDVEVALTQVQIDYYNTVGAPAGYIESLTDYKNNTGAILARIGQEV